MTGTSTKPTEVVQKHVAPSGVAHLLLFSWCQIIVYFDRGIVSGVLDFISDEVDGAESKFRAGLLGGMFMIGFMIAAPLFVRLAQRSASWTIYSMVIGLSCCAYLPLRHTLLPIRLRHCFWCGGYLELERLRFARWLRR